MTDAATSTTPSTRPEHLEDFVRALDGKVLAIYYVGGEYVVNYGGQSVKKGSTIAAALGAAKVEP